jgi:hypothetical protein
MNEKGQSSLSLLSRKLSRMNSQVKPEHFIKTVSNFDWKFLVIDLLSDEDDKTIYGSVKSWIKHLVFAVNFFNIFTYGFLTTSHILDTEFDLAKVTFGISFCSTMTMMAVKYACVYLNQSKFRGILERLPSSYNYQITKTFKIDERLTRMTNIMSAYKFYMWTSLPFLLQGPIVVYLMTSERILPHLLVFPFDTTTILAYAFTWIWIIIAHCSHVIAMVCCDHVIYGIINVMQLEFDILRTRFENFKDIKKENDVKKEFGSCISRHEELHAIATELNTILQPTFSFNWLMSSFIICFNAFQASSVQMHFLAVIFNGLFCLSTLNHIFLQCFFVQRLKDSSERVVNGIYDCGWEQLKSLQLKKDLMVVIQRAQKPAAFSAFGISEINMHQFEQVRTH